MTFNSTITEKASEPSNNLFLYTGVDPCNPSDSEVAAGCFTAATGVKCTGVASSHLCAAGAPRKPLHKDNVQLMHRAAIIYETYLPLDNVHGYATFCNG